ncbi:MAG: glycosyltransferase family 4 protein [Alphaproteobacteria bacterium]|nr:glycosyltransferase family 4 protein [Alphaproteobacteria bacterium]
MTSAPRIAILLKGYPRLSETFIANEIEGLEARGLELLLVSLRHPTDRLRHPVHDRIKAEVLYLPEYLHEEPRRVMRALVAVTGQGGLKRALKAWASDLGRDLTRNRLRRFGQAIVLAAELPQSVRHLHAHFIHTPASVASYAAKIRGLGFSMSAHARDIWTTPQAELRAKLGGARWTAVCSGAGETALRSAGGAGARIERIYHGLNLEAWPSAPLRDARDGTDPAAPLRILSVGRRVPKKGFDVLLTALARLPADLHWRWQHIGGGPEGPRLKALAGELGLAPRITWEGAATQDTVRDAMRQADLFVLASRRAKDGDQDGLPNVLLEAMAQRLPVIATKMSAIPELIGEDGPGLLVPTEDPAALASAIESAIRNPAWRAIAATKGDALVRERFASARGYDIIAERLMALSA